MCMTMCLRFILTTCLLVPLLVSPIGIITFGFVIGLYCFTVWFDSGYRGRNDSVQRSALFKMKNYQRILNGLTEITGD